MMADLVQSIFIVDITILIIIEILCWIYLLTILCVKRFHTTVNILTGNVCLASIICCLFWIINYTSSSFYRSIFSLNATACVFGSFLPDLVNGSMIYSLVMVTINRFFTLIYPANLLFKRKTWALICSIIPWIFVSILSIPKIIQSVQLCFYNESSIYHMDWYILWMIILLPSSIKGIFNLLIFLHVRASSRRIRAVTTIYPPEKQPLTHQHSRDIHLLKHILFIFIVFVAGWTPIYLMSIIAIDDITLEWLFAFLQILPVISALIIILDLFWYNYDLRRCLQDRLNNNLRFRRQS